MYLTPRHDKCTFAKVLDIRCESTPGSSFGRYLSGYIKLRGCTTTIRFENSAGCYSLGRLKIFKETASDEIEGRNLRSNVKGDIRELKGKNNTSEKSNSQHGRQREEECYWVCMDAVEDMLEAKGKSVTCLDIMRDKVPADSQTYISALILSPVPGEAEHFHRINFSTMTPESFQGAELADVTII